MSEQRLTEAEWRKRQAQQECANFGHSWQIVQTFGGVPISLHCERNCGEPAYDAVPQKRSASSATS